MGLEDPLGRRREPPEVPARLPGEALDEVAGQRRDVLPPGVQRGHVDGEDADAVEEVAPEPAGLDPGDEVPGRRHDDARTRGPPGYAARAPEPALLEEPQQRRLARRTRLSDVRQKEGPGSGGGDRPRPPLEAEVRIANRGGQRIGGQPDEREGGPCGAAVNRPRHQLLADADVTGDQDRGVGGCDPRDPFPDAPHLRTVAHDVVRAPRFPGPGVLPRHVALERSAATLRRPRGPAGRAETPAPHAAWPATRLRPRLAPGLPIVA